MSEVCTDRLEALLVHFPVRARTFHAGSLCGSIDDHSSNKNGQLHLIKEGKINVTHSSGETIEVREPSLLLYPRPIARQFVTDGIEVATSVCAEIEFDGGNANPIVSALPKIVCLPLSRIDGASETLALLFGEAFSDKCGRHALVDRLFEVVLILVLRQLMESEKIETGMLAGLSHPKLRKSLIAMHEQPSQNWSLDALADISGMSRSVFAGTFHHVVGCTPGVYLQGWRVRLAQQHLKQGKQLKTIAFEVGYGSEAALSRAFKAQCGTTPREWRNEHLGA
ncbi:cupin domain-containing protein [Undibacterium sp. MH2W]|uniref:AraC family transcriptional regulator n=1 Tax=Undibacterium sp. MH2W TaxID=3413044 RepID=UPI003BF2AA5F